MANFRALWLLQKIRCWDSENRRDALKIDDTDPSLPRLEVGDCRRRAVVQTTGEILLRDAKILPCTPYSSADLPIQYVSQMYSPFVRTNLDEQIVTHFVKTTRYFDEKRIL